jgi:hypothetical protein
MATLPGSAETTPLTFSCQNENTRTRRHQHSLDTTVFVTSLAKTTAATTTKTAAYPNQTMAFLPGDHIFISRGMPSLSTTIVVLHHAIVVSTIDAHRVEIVEYGVYNSRDGTKKWVAGHGLDHGLLKEVGEVKRRTIDLQLEPGWTMATNLSDAYPAPAVIAHALFILANPSLLPPYHLTNSNGECVARWCKTGRFESSQAKGVYDTTVQVITEKVTPFLDTSGKAVSKAIAPKTGAAATTTTTGETTTPSNTPSSGTSGGGMARTQEKASSAIQQAADQVVKAVRAVGAMVGNREQAVLDTWSHINETLDLAFAQHVSGDTTTTK